MKLSKEKAIQEIKLLVLTQCMDSFDASYHLQATGLTCQVPWMEVIAEVEKELNPTPVQDESTAQVINLSNWVNANRRSDKIPNRLSAHLSRFTA